MSGTFGPVAPFRIKSVEPLNVLTRDEREIRLEQARYNVFKIPARDVFIDLLTDSGTGAMSDRQWAGIMRGDESYAGCRNFEHFQRVVRDLTGMPHVIPVHQGRAAEHLLFSTVCKPGDRVISNIHFDTTRANVEYQRAEATDCVIDEGLQPTTDHPFKGNVDLDKLRSAIEEVGPERVPLVIVTVTNNSGGGQPVSLTNLREVKQVLESYDIPLFLDAARFAENAFFIHEREEPNKSVRDIAKEMFRLADGTAMSCKKDGLANMGGFLALHDDEWARKITDKLILFEGFPTYGGLSGRDLEAVARGLEEVTDLDYLTYRIGQVRFLGERLKEGGVPIITPVGGHAIFIDAKACLPHVPQSQYPGIALTIALYREAGIRGTEIGSVMFAKPDDSGEEVPPAMELVRLAIPRRVYDNSQLAYVADVAARIARDPSGLRGVRFTYQAPTLRHFTAEFEEV
jgi:tyrosine phenol-lyase